MARPIPGSEYSMHRKQLKSTPPDYYALWDDVPCPGHAVLISVYEEETRARVCAGVLGCSVRPMTVALLRDYLAWRATQSPEAYDPDPLNPLPPARPRSDPAPFRPDRLHRGQAGGVPVSGIPVTKVTRTS